MTSKNKNEFQAEHYALSHETNESQGMNSNGHNMMIEMVNNTVHIPIFRIRFFSHRLQIVELSPRNIGLSPSLLRIISL